MHLICISARETLLIVTSWFGPGGSWVHVAVVCFCLVGGCSSVVAFSIKKEKVLERKRLGNFLCRVSDVIRSHLEFGTDFFFFFFSLLFTFSALESGCFLM